MKRIVLGAITAASALVLAACGSSSTSSGANGSSASTTPSSSGSATAQHNSADITFAQMMIPHHAQAIEMAKLAATRSQSADVKALASQIEAAQQPEIDKMTGWLNSWGQSVPDTSMGSMSHDMGSMTDSGMMSSDDMKMLTDTSGATFDHHFLTMMISHHQGAISMAKTEQTSGSYPDAKAMANSIVTSQTAEITKMQSMLKSMG